VVSRLAGGAHFVLPGILLTTSASPDAFVTSNSTCTTLNDGNENGLGFALRIYYEDDDATQNLESYSSRNAALDRVHCQKNNASTQASKSVAYSSEHYASRRDMTSFSNTRYPDPDDFDSLAEFAAAYARAVVIFVVPQIGFPVLNGGTLLNNSSLDPMQPLTMYGGCCGTMSRVRCAARAIHSIAIHEHSQSTGRARSIPRLLVVPDTREAVRAVKEVAYSLIPTQRLPRGEFARGQQIFNGLPLPQTRIHTAKVDDAMAHVITNVNDSESNQWQQSYRKRNQDTLIDWAARSSISVDEMNVAIRGYRDQLSHSLQDTMPASLLVAFADPDSRRKLAIPLETRTQRLISIFFDAPN
jgi:hypothetical protein